MTFCANCGTHMEDGAKFCPSCGTAAGASSAAKPEKEKAGNIVKCLNCGAPVPSMAPVCPDCGHEFRNVKTSGSVTTFFDKLAEATQRQWKNQAAKNRRSIQAVSSC